MVEDIPREAKEAVKKAIEQRRMASVWGCSGVPVSAEGANGAFRRKLFLLPLGSSEKEVAQAFILSCCEDDPAQYKRASISDFSFIGQVTIPNEAESSHWSIAPLMAGLSRKS